MIDAEKHNINAGNSTYCVDITISDNVADGFFSTAIHAGDFTYCADDVSDGMIAKFDAVNFTDCADI